MGFNKILVLENLSETKASLKSGILFSVTTQIGVVCLVKVNETLKFFKNSCPHLNVPFTQSGVCNSFGEIVCKEHGHRYSLTSGFECEGRNEKIEFIPYEIEGENLFLIV